MADESSEEEEDDLQKSKGEEADAIFEDRKNRTRKTAVKNLKLLVVDNNDKDGHSIISLEDIIESDIHKKMTELTRKVARKENEMKRFLDKVSSRLEANLVLRNDRLSENSLVEERRAAQLHANTEVKERFEIEVDTKMLEQQQLQADLLYSNKQISLGLPGKKVRGSYIYLSALYLCLFHSHLSHVIHV